MTALSLTLKVNGQQVTEMIELLAVDILREANRISRAQLVLIDGDTAERRFELSNKATFAAGQDVEILAGYENSPVGKKSIFKGIVVGQRVEAGPRGSQLTVYLKDKAVRLTFGRQTRTFQNKTDGQIFKQIIDDHGLKKGKIPTTNPQHQELVQYQATNWDFLLLRAEANGLLVITDDGTLSIVPPDFAPPARHRIRVGIDDLFEFEMRFDAGHQTTSVETEAWDIKNNRLTKPIRSKPVRLPQGSNKPAEITAAAGSQAVTRVNGLAVSQPTELNPWVDGLLTRQRLGFFQGRLSLPGKAAYRLMDTIQIKGIGDRFNGKTLITGLRHRFTTQLGWTTDLQVGLSPDSYAHRPDIHHPPAGGLLPAVRGLHIGLVDAFKKDPDGHYRLQVRLYGEKEITVWARMAFPDSGKSRGLVFWPEPGDEVVVGFINEDPRQAVILGSLFSQKNPVPDQSLEPSQKNITRGMVTKKKSQLLFIDDDKGKLLIKTGGGQEIQLDDDGGTIQIKDEHGNKISMEKDGITIKSAKDLTLEASGKVNIKGNSIDLN